MTSAAEMATVAGYTETSIQARVAAFLAQARQSTSDGMSWAEFGELLIALLRLAVGTLDHIATLSGPDKKALVLEAVASLFDQLAGRAIPVAMWPVWVVVRPAVRSLVLALASGAIEVVLPMVRSE
jgi:hypothetical protein